ncbi:MAG: TonB-dependent receptor plug domain-containing protein, partial [Bacteroidales bacterium]|nr:TonB-dependent receptor plug domain-containing protein [Bacteroidales bacterium]
MAALIFSSAALYAQDIDTTGIYGERQDSLDAAVFVSRQAGNYLSKGKEIRTEVISAAGLCKMACCNLAESFENSASVTVGYSDAVTGARQIRLLGLSGTYTQMLDENRPVMRGLSAPFGLSYVPGQWLESIQIAKGSSSVINGVESMTGQINMEHRKPTDEKPLFINGLVMSDTKMD